MRKNLFLIAMSILVLALLLVGCAKQQTAAPTAPAPAAQQATTQQTATTADAKQEFIDLLAKKSSITGAVEFEVKASLNVQTGPGQTLKQDYNGVQTLTYKNKEVRLDFIQNYDGQLIQTTVFENAKTYCFSTGQCQALKADSIKDRAYNVRTAVESNPSAYKITSFPAKTIINKPAKCYKVFAGTGGSDNVAAYYCFSAEGFQLYNEIVSQKSGEQFSYIAEATGLNEKVADAAMVVPNPSG